MAGLSARDYGGGLSTNGHLERVHAWRKCTEAFAVSFDVLGPVMLEDGRSAGRKMCH